MAMNWTLEYENQPRNVSNPGFIADSVRTLKTAIRERMTLEHFYGSTESTSWGNHREGSARVFVIDADSPRDDATVLKDDYVGRTKINLEVLASVPQAQGSDVTGEELVQRVIQVYDKDDALIDVFDPGLYVSRTQDLNITGRKIYTGDNPEVQEDMTDLTWTDMGAAEQVRADQKAVKRITIKDWTDTAQDHNIFDVSDTDNSITPLSPAGTNDIDGSGNTTTHSISANVIVANKVYGAVYS